MTGQSDIDRFFRDGYLLIDAQAGHLLNQVLAEATDLYLELGLDPSGISTRVEDGWRKSDAVRSAAHLPAVLGTLESLYLRSPLPFRTENFPVGPGQSLQATTIHFNTFPSNFVCGVWLALERTDADNAPLELCPGSHRLPEYTIQDAGAGIGDIRRYEEFITRLAGDKQLPSVRVPMEKGQALIWHGNLLHRVYPCTHGTRHSQVCYYYFDGCSYFNPLLSTPERIHWHNPRWIRPLPAAGGGPISFLKRGWCRMVERLSD